MAMHPDERREWEEEGYGDLADLLDRVWPHIRDRVWLAAPRHERWLLYRPPGDAGTNQN